MKLDEFLTHEFLFENQTGEVAQRRRAYQEKALDKLGSFGGYK